MPVSLDNISFYEPPKKSAQALSSHTEASRIVLPVTSDFIHIMFPRNTSSGPRVNISEAEQDLARSSSSPEVIGQAGTSGRVNSELEDKGATSAGSTMAKSTKIEPLLEPSTIKPNDGKEFHSLQTHEGVHDHSTKGTFHGSEAPSGLHSTRPLQGRRMLSFASRTFPSEVESTSTKLRDQVSASTRDASDLPDISTRCIDRPTTIPDTIPTGASTNTMPHSSSTYFEASNLLVSQSQSREPCGDEQHTSERPSSPGNVTCNDTPIRAESCFEDTVSLPLSRGRATSIEIAPELASQRTIGDSLTSMNASLRKHSPVLHCEPISPKRMCTRGSPRGGSVGLREPGNERVDEAPYEDFEFDPTPSADQQGKKEFRVSGQRTHSTLDPSHDRSIRGTSHCKIDHATVTSARLPTCAETSNRFEEWSLRDAILKRVTVGGASTLQVQFSWNPDPATDHSCACSGGEGFQLSKRDLHGPIFTGVSEPMTGGSPSPDYDCFIIDQKEIDGETYFLCRWDPTYEHSSFVSDEAVRIWRETQKQKTQTVNKGNTEEKKANGVRRRGRPRKNPLPK
ncbi:hypothetical protein BKA67DRAFT_569293 [Truncatella angustata]|uniref:Uncharacterized protein n=1 Tax=Truncatella angustata TaxID=152316 RepID=A0A9P8ZW78_9PEZI|nr:uncharacterized protein BKA67DRAFT_569293 [Truncatella angustata]KAH6653370.1 hypothetical protein BKA67DRAFT_569293 [Truncatella angustata]